MNNHHCSFVRFRTIPSACIANSELDGGMIANVNPTFQAEPIRVIPFDMDVDGPTTIQSQQKKRGIEKMTHIETTCKRLRTIDMHWQAVTASSCNNDNNTSSQRHALSIDLIVSHIIGYLPWKQQILSCSRVSKQWNQACFTAPVQVLLFPTKRCLTRVLEPCNLERSLNEMSWKAFSQMPDAKILSKIARLDIWGDLDWHEKNKNHEQSQHQISYLGHLEELNLRYMSLDALLEFFPESKYPRFVQLTKLVIQEWGSKNAQSTNRINEERRDLLRKRILFHAPNLLILKAV